MIRIGITGQDGFIGSHLYNTLQLFKERFTCIRFEKHFFDDVSVLDAFVMQCDAIVHLAAKNRHAEPDELHNTNVGLTEKLVDALNRTQSRAHIVFASSTQEDRDNHYGRSKLRGRMLLTEWADSRTGGTVCGLVIPNVFGPFCKPFYNSVVATFSHQLVTGQKPGIDQDASLGLIYVASLVNIIIEAVSTRINQPLVPVSPQKIITVSELLGKLGKFRDEYFINGFIPAVADNFDRDLFNTFRSYIDHSSFFPRLLKKHDDPRGTFCEIIRLRIGGQISFSSTNENFTRGNHFHTRKIERFTVIAGKAVIQLRQIGTPRVLEFELDGSQPSYVDIPVWYTHNIRNTGTGSLYTVFWINEPFNQEDPDTFAEVV